MQFRKRGSLLNLYAPNLSRSSSFHRHHYQRQFQGSVAILTALATITHPAYSRWRSERVSLHCQIRIEKET